MEALDGVLEFGARRFLEKIMKAWQKTALIAAGVVLAAAGVTGGVALADDPTSPISMLPLLGLVGFVAIMFTSLDDAESD
jgi:hypothetical protein